VGRRGAEAELRHREVGRPRRAGGLGIGIVVSVGLTAIGTAFTDAILRAADLERVGGMHNLVSIAGYVLAVVGDVLIFSWMLGRLPQARAPARVVLKGALLAAVGFGVLKVIGTYYIARVASSPTVGAFGSIIGVLVWIDLVSRYLLYCAAWTATGVAPAAQAAAIEPEQLPPPGPPARPAMSPLRVATSLFGAGIAVGGGAMAAALTARRHRRRASG
jgi:membrane protein